MNRFLTGFFFLALLSTGCTRGGQTSFEEPKNIKDKSQNGLSYKKSTVNHNESFVKDIKANSSSEHNVEGIATIPVANSKTGAESEQSVEGAPTTPITNSKTGAESEQSVEGAPTTPTINQLQQDEWDKIFAIFQKDIQLDMGLKSYFLSRAFIKKNCEKNILNKKNHSGETLLHALLKRSALKSNKKIAQFGIKCGMDPSIEDKTGTPAGLVGFQKQAQENSLGRKQDILQILLLNSDMRKKAELLWSQKQLLSTLKEILALYPLYKAIKLYNAIQSQSGYKLIAEQEHLGIYRVPCKKKKPTRFAIFVHGMKDSYQNMAEIAKLLASNQKDTVESYIIALGGHEGGPKEMGLQNWLKQIKEAYDIVRKRAGNKPIYYFGFSMGGALGAYSVQNGNIKVKEMYLFHPPIVLSKFFSPLVRVPLGKKSVLIACKNAINEMRNYLDSNTDKLNSIKTYIMTGDKDVYVSHKRTVKWIRKHNLTNWTDTRVIKGKHLETPNLITYIATRIKQGDSHK